MGVGDSPASAAKIKEAVPNSEGGDDGVASKEDEHGFSSMNHNGEGELSFVDLHGEQREQGYTCPAEKSETPHSGTKNRGVNCGNCSTSVKTQTCCGCYTVSIKEMLCGWLVEKKGSGPFTRYNAK